ncbi:F-box/LRR-repeat protein At4g14103-like [Elaeis guineensis]|uniref:F-box/LRR-repeat protein At4g14103-like n=1 Tax=Elaeis guineensis var. tenera TaxID=51953 RepID=UPI003C6D5A55
MSIGRIEGSGCGTMEIGRSRDRISELPDAILHHIFSFLPTRQLVEASILSKRWAHLWESTPTLSFSSDDFDSTMDGRRRFTNFIDTVLLLRDASDISTVRLRWTGEGKDLEQADRWLRFVVKRNVKRLELQMHLYIDEILPSCIFNCQSLQVLKLEVMCGFIGLPGPVSLPKLKRLEVSYAEFLDDDSLKDLLSGCPLLQVLSFEHCYFTSLEICSPELKSLELYVPDDADTTIRISAPKLLSLTYWGMVFQELTLMNLSSLTYASVCLFFNSLNDDIEDTDRCRRISNVLTGLHNVESLEFLSGAFKFLLQMRDRSQSLPLFRNLKHLRAGISLDKDGITGITSLLQCSPNLEFLVIDQYKVPQNLCVEGGSIATMPDSTRLCHLRVVEINNFGATEHELSFVKLLSGNIFSAEKVALVPSKKTENQVMMHADGSSSTTIQHEEIQGLLTSSSLPHAGLQ